MVRKYKPRLGARRNQNYSAVDLEAARQGIGSGRLSYGEAAKSYGIPKTTLLNKIKNPHQKSYGGQIVFSKEEEASLVELIQVCGTYGQPLTKLDVRMVVKNLLDATNRKIEEFNNNVPGEGWINGFLKRHKVQIQLKAAQNIKKARAEKTIEEMQSYFDHLAPSIEGIPPTHIINYDETNLTDDPGKKQAIFKRGTKYPELVRTFTKGETFVMFAGTASGHLLPLYVVYKSENMWTSWWSGGPQETPYNRTKSGWFDSQTFCDWFKTVIVPYCRRLSGTKVLIGDNLSSHFNPGILKICRESEIRFIVLPENSTHLTQPLNVVYFGPLKRSCRKILDIFKTDNPNLPSHPKQFFPRILQNLLDDIEFSSAQNLRAGFKKCGIFPFCPNKVISRLPSSGQNVGPAVSEAVLNHLQATRAPKEKQRQRRKKFNVTPGSSVTLEQISSAPIQPEAPVGASCSRKTSVRKRKTVPNPAAPRKCKETRKAEKLVKNRPTVRCSTRHQLPK